MGDSCAASRLLGSSRRLAAFILVVAASLGVSACPFSYDLPLSSPLDAITDSALPGDWKIQDPDTGQWVVFELLRYSEKEYVAWSREPQETGDKVVVYRIFVTPIEGERFLNVQELGSGNDRSWCYANYRVSGDMLSLRFVDEAIFSSQTFGSSEALHEFVRRNLHDPSLYMSDDGKESVMTWQRVRK